MPISLKQTMTASAVRPLLRLIKEYDIPLNDILQDTFLSENKLKNDRLPISSFDLLINNVARLTQRDDIGFIAGQSLELESFNLLGFLLSSCNTGRDALVTMRRYYMLLSDSPAPEIFTTKNEIKVIYHITDGNELAMRARSELIATSIHTLGRSLAGNLYQPFKMGFKHSKPKYHTQLDEFFAVDIAYDQPECWISFAAEHVDQPLQYSNPNLFNAIRKQAEGLLEGCQNPDSTYSKVRHVLLQWPNQHAANKEAVAELLNTSPRTLTRRLQEENTQFSHLLRDVRMEKAQIKLKSHTVDMQDLAHQLGFADRRGFERAFKQWCGHTPSAFHKNWKMKSLQLEEA